MTMKFLLANTDAQGIHYSVWLDTTQGTEDNPDEAYVKSYDWPPFDTSNPPMTGDVAMTADQYQQMTLDEVKLLASADLAAIQQAANPTPPIPMSVEGQTF